MSSLVMIGPFTIYPQSYTWVLYGFKIVTLATYLINHMNITVCTFQVWSDHLDFEVFPFNNYIYANQTRRNIIIMSEFVYCYIEKQNYLELCIMENVFLTFSIVYFLKFQVIESSEHSDSPIFFRHIYKFFHW